MIGMKCLQDKDRARAQMQLVARQWARAPRIPEDEAFKTLGPRGASHFAWDGDSNDRPPKKLGSQQDVQKKNDDLPVRSAVATMSQTMHTACTWLETGDGRKSWELDAASAQAFKDKGTWDLQGVRVKFFGTKGSTYTVTGESGAIQTETKDMEIRGNVVTTTSEGYTFRSEITEIYGEEKKISTLPMKSPLRVRKKTGSFELQEQRFQHDIR